MISKYNSIGVPFIKVYALGGLDENGKNLYCIETPDSIFIIEAGLKYPDNSNPGVDIIIPDFTYLEMNKDKVKAIIISHGHDDMYGGISYLLKKVGQDTPVYLTMTTKIIIEADLLSKAKNINFNVIKPSDDIMINGYSFHFFSTAHTVMESIGFSLETQAGSIVYTGNYISDFGVHNHFYLDLPKIAKIAEEHSTLLMLCESIGADKLGIASPTHKLTPHIKNMIEEGEQRVIIATYNQNLYMISEVIKLAIDNNKRIVLTNEKLLSALPYFMANGDLMIPRNNQCSLQEINKYKPSDLIVLLTDTGENLFNDIIQIAKGESELYKELVLTDDDIFVNAAIPAPSFEKLSVAAQDELYKVGCNVKFLKKNDISSMHAQQEDIKMLLSIFHPKYYMPIQGEFRQLMANANIAQSLGYQPENIFLLDNGMGLSFDRAGNALTPVLQIFQPGSTFIDGLGVGDVKSSIINERNAMKSAGIICISALYSKNYKQIVSEPQIDIKGLVSSKEIDNIKKHILNTLNQYIPRLYEDNINVLNVKNKLIESLTKMMKDMTSKEPIISLNIINIDDLN